jgi:hypothetical protein
MFSIWNAFCDLVMVPQNRCKSDTFLVLLWLDVINNQIRMLQIVHKEV